MNEHVMFKTKQLDQLLSTTFNLEKCTRKLVSYIFKKFLIVGPIEKRSTARTGQKLFKT